MKHGTVLVFGATLETTGKLYKIKQLEQLSNSAIRAVGLNARRAVWEDYKQPEGAYTFIVFLDESHFILTTYPEDKIIELEFSSCKQVNLEPLVKWLQSHEEFMIKSQFCTEKNDKGEWARSL